MDGNDGIDTWEMVGSANEVLNADELTPSITRILTDSSSSTSGNMGRLLYPNAPVGGRIGNGIPGHYTPMNTPIPTSVTTPTTPTRGRKRVPSLEDALSRSARAGSEAFLNALRGTQSDIRDYGKITKNASASDTRASASNVPNTQSVTIPILTRQRNWNSGIGPLRSLWDIMTFGGLDNDLYVPEPDSPESASPPQKVAVFEASETMVDLGQALGVLKKTDCSNEKTYKVPFKDYSDDDKERFDKLITKIPLANEWKKEDRIFFNWMTKTFQEFKNWDLDKISWIKKVDCEGESWTSSLLYKTCKLGDQDHIFAFKKIDTLSNVKERMAKGLLNLVFLSGPVGVGKSTILDRLAGGQETSILKVRQPMGIWDYMIAHKFSNYNYRQHHLDVFKDTLQKIKDHDKSWHVKCVVVENDPITSALHFPAFPVKSIQQEAEIYDKYCETMSNNGIEFNADRNSVLLFLIGDTNNVHQRKLNRRRTYEVVQKKDVIDTQNSMMVLSALWFHFNRKSRTVLFMFPDETGDSVYKLDHVKHTIPFPSVFAKQINYWSDVHLQTKPITFGPLLPSDGVNPSTPNWLRL